MFGLGGWELGIILFIILLVFGVGKLPELGGGMGKAIKNFKKAVTDTEKEEIKDKTETDKIEEK